MKSLDEIEGFCDSIGQKPSRKLFKGYRKGFVIFAGSFTVAFLFFSIVLLPFYSRESELVEGDGFVADVLGDEDNPAFDYWYAPDNSFGMKEFKSVNWTTFKNLFRNNFQVSLEYRITDTWIENNDYLDVSFDWQDEGYWKINLTFIKPPSPELDVRFTVAMNRAVLDYVERAGQYEYWINYTANETDVYNVFFNWSDLMSVPGLIFNHGVLDDLFWFRFRKDDVPANGETVEYVFDPTFGGLKSGNELSMTTGSYNYLRGDYDAPASNGYADSISVEFSTLGGVNRPFECALYEYVDYSSNYAGDLLGVTESKTVTSTGVWTFNFSDPKPSITASTNYYYCVRPDGDFTGQTIKVDGAGSGSGIYIRNANEVPFSDPLTGDDSLVYDLSAYVTYSLGNKAPVFSNPSPSMAVLNESVGVVTCNVTVSDPDGDNMNISFLTSTDNSSFTHQQFNASVNNGSVEFDYTVSDYQTVHYWKITADDGSGNNESFVVDFETTPYRTLFFNDTFPNENYVDSNNNMTFEAGWENFTIGSVAVYSSSGDFNDGSEDQLFSSEDGFVHDVSDDEGWYYGANTPSGSTGADSPYEGTRMLYIESSAGHYQYSNFVDFPITLTPTTNVTIEFQYYMYGLFTKYLSVELVDSGGVTIGSMWNLSGQQQTAGNQDWRMGICGIDDLGSYSGNYDIRFHGRTADADYRGDICIDWIFINQTNASSNDAWILSDEIFLPNEGYSWDTFDAWVNDTVSCSFALVDPNDQSYNITSGLTGNGDDISSVTNTSVMIFGNFSDDSVSMQSWNISWSEEGGGEPEASMVWGLNFSWNFSFSNSSRVFINMNQFNFSFSNTSRVFNNVNQFNFSFSNTSRAFTNTGLFNFSFSNSSRVFNLVNSFNFSFSNSSKSWGLPFSFNFSFSNGSRVFTNMGQFNFSFSNTSRMFYNMGQYNFSFSNSSKVFNNVEQFNFSFSNSSRIFNNVNQFNFSFSNTSGVAQITISNVYPSNNSYNIALQPYLIATFNSSGGNLLNVTWYYNGSSLGVDSNQNNGTLTELMYEATGRATSYLWEVKVNDGEGNWFNRSYVFTTEGYSAGFAGGSGSGINSVYGLIGIIGIVGLLALLYKRKKENDFEE